MFLRKRLTSSRRGALRAFPRIRRPAPPGEQPGRSSLRTASRPGDEEEPPPAPARGRICAGRAVVFGEEPESPASFPST